MSTVLYFYQQQAHAAISQIPWLTRLQETAIADFSQLGFPNRHHEEWKYTTFESFLKHRFASVGAPKRDEFTPDIPVELKLSVVNGEIIGCDELSKQLPKGVILQPLAQALLEQEDKIKPHLSKILKSEHAFQALNTANLQHGFFLYIPRGIQLTAPLSINYWQEKEEQAVHLRNLIIADAQSEGTLIENYQGAANCSYFTNTITEIYVGKKAQISHYKIQNEGKSAYHIGHLAIVQNAESQFQSHSLSLGGKLVRSDISIRLCEPQAACLLNGIYAPAEGQHIDHHTTIFHDVPDCRSEQDYKGILNGNSRAVFNGKVVVAKDAQHTQAKQQNKNLLLSSNTEIDTKPQLEIFADDVICTHGATVGQLDEDALFYLATRGISQAEASGYLIRAFADENLSRIPQNDLKNWMVNLLNKQIG